MQVSFKHIQRLTRPSWFATSKGKDFHAMIMEYQSARFGEAQICFRDIEKKYAAFGTSRGNIQLEIVADDQKTDAGVISLDEHRPHPSQDNDS